MLLALLVFVEKIIVVLWLLRNEKKKSDENWTNKFELFLKNSSRLHFKLCIRTNEKSEKKTTTIAKSRRTLRGVTMKKVTICISLKSIFILFGLAISKYALWWFRVQSKWRTVMCNFFVRFLPFTCMCDCVCLFYFIFFFSEWERWHRNWKFTRKKK